MQFNSYTFMAFFVIVMAVYVSLTSWRAQKVWLLLTSYVFYAAWDPVFIVLVWLSTVIDWTSAKWIYHAPQRRKKLLLVLSILVNLGVLAYFKYGNFLLENFVAGMQAMGIDYKPAPFDIILPIGISFYTFHSLSYTLDVYLGRATPWDSVLDFALYVTFFPALVAGPILRSSQFLPQCRSPRRASAQMFGWGMALLFLGLFQKQVVADVVMAPAVDHVFKPGRDVGFLDAWIGTLAFAGQIVSDFAGYSTSAIGVALCLGFTMPDNFRFPYAAIGFSDFWQRWHISLSSFLRDYLYIPLGGNRKGPTRTYVNLMLTMLIGGLWHGASWTFVVWGGLHGMYLIGERVAEHTLPPGAWRQTLWARLLGVAVTFVLVCIAWVFFRAESFGQAFSLIGSMFGLVHGERVLEGGNYPLVGGAMLAILAIHWWMRDRTIEQVADRTPWGLRSVVLGAMIIAVVLMQEKERAFLYFQF
jgi:D-alanyl-lipoteichoic acid acyltransferase DltB (MBOAT superfamily)